MRPGKLIAYLRARRHGKPTSRLRRAGIFAALANAGISPARALLQQLERKRRAIAKADSRRMERQHGAQLIERPERIDPSTTAGGAAS